MEKAKSSSSQTQAAVRLQFEIPKDRVGELDALMAECRIRTRTDLMNSALMFFEWAVQELKKGRIIASVDENNSKYKEVVTEPFQNVSRNHARQTALAAGN